MKKYFSIILLVLVMCTTLLSGCNLTTLNVSDYNSQIVAQYGTMKINKKELNMAYNSSGSNYTNSGMSVEDAIIEVINDIVNRKLLIDYSKNTYGVISMSETEFRTLTQQQRDQYAKGPYGLYVNKNKYYDFNTTINGVYDYINEQVLTFENDIRLQKGLTKVDPNATESEADDANEFDGYKKYESSLTTDGQQNIVKKVKNNVATTVAGEFVLSVYGNSEISNQALHRYLIKVRNANYELYKNCKTYDSILKTHILELYPTYEGNRYTSIVQEEFEKTLPLEETSILTFYKNKVEESYAKYNTTNGYSQYVTDMQSDPSKVYWHYEGSKGFVLTAHVLIKFDDVTVKKLKDLETQKEDGAISENYYTEQRNAILNAQGTCERDVETGNKVYIEDENGKMVEKFYTYLEIYEMIYNDLAKYDIISDENLRAQKKAEAFNKYVYMFGMDSGSINSNHYYACNLDTSVKDSLVENYANTTREMYKNQGIGSLSEPVLVEESNYSGYHIILVVNESKNLVSYNNLKNINIDVLNSERPMIGINKTTLDVVYDAITKETYNNYHGGLIADLRDKFAGDARIDLFPYNYKSLLNN